MSKVVYEGHELEHFDNAHNFRNYQLQLIKNYLGLFFNTTSSQTAD